MRSAVAAMLVITLGAGCFPHNARNRTIAEIVEGGVAVSGVVIEGVVQSGADCDMTHAPGTPPVACKSTAATAGGIGVALILAGLVGFIATISTSEDDEIAKPAETKVKPAATLPAAVPTPPPGAPAATPPSTSPAPPATSTN